MLATNNPGKVRELRRLLSGLAFELITPADLGIALDVAETGSTYAENAGLKAKAFAHAANCLALADDSGIEVDALAGRPGVLSARFGGPALDDPGRTRHLLHELEGVALGRRTARYRAVVAIASPSGEVAFFEGVQEGTIAGAPRGNGGFGYDPVFLVDGTRTQAEIPEAEKDAISHRGQAARAAAVYLRGLAA